MHIHVYVCQNHIYMVYMIYNINTIDMKINEFRLSVYCLLLKSIGVNQCLVYIFFFGSSISSYPPPPTFLGRLSILNKITKGHLKSFSQCLPEGICSSLFWGPCNLLVDAERYINIASSSYMTYFVYLGTIIFKKSSYYGRLLPVGKQFKWGNSHSLYKRENAGADFLNPEHFVANALKWNRKHL